MRIEENVLKLIDIDCFFRIGNIPIFIATNGGLLPEELNDEEKLIEYSQRVSELPENKEKNSIIINWRYVHKRLAEQDLPARKSYLYSFRKMARKGFYAYDRDIEYHGRNVYKLVAWPTNQLQLEAIDLIEMPIKKILCKCEMRKGILECFCLM